MSTPHILITGGAGFIGSHLADRMLAKGFRVTVFDCLLPQVHADGETGPDGWPVYLNPQAQRIFGNVLDADAFQEALLGVTHLAHLAASVGVGQSMTDIVAYTRNNTLAAATMLEVLSRKQHSVQRIAVASSMSIYGEGEYQAAAGGSVASGQRPLSQLRDGMWEVLAGNEVLEPIPTRETKALDPASIYAINKRDHEEMFLAVGKALNIPTVALRLFNAYGSRQALSNPYTGVAAIFISRLLNDQAPLVFEDGEQMRDFVHVGDVAAAFATVLESDQKIWDTFNVGSGHSVTVNQVANTLARLLGKNIAPEILNQYRFGDIRHCFADISKIREAFQFVPQHDFEGGMAELIEWVRHARKPVDRSSQSMAELQGAGLVA